MCKVIAYYRVSTKRQGQSGLGLDGQREAVETYLRQNDCQLVGEYTEVESGKHSDRPELAKALQHAKSARAILVVAKLDRLARNVAFLSALMEAGVDFVACDNPHATRLTVHILAAVAEDEARRISERTKAALAAAKRRGVKLGSAREGHWEGQESRRKAGAKKGSKVSAIVRSDAARRENAFVLGIIGDMRGQGATWQTIADRLNADGHVTRRGNAWSAASVWQLVKVTAAGNVE